MIAQALGLVGRTLHPLVSVCCVTYNHARYIRDAMEGFLMQQVSFPFEIIVHDDASTDGTAEIVKEYEARFPGSIIGIYQSANQYSLGKIPLPSFVFPRIRGRYFALCEGDDFWTDPAKLQTQVDFLEQHPAYVGCCSDYSLRDVDGKILVEKTQGSNHVSQHDRISILEVGLPMLCTVVYRAIQEVFELRRQMPMVANGDQVLAALMARHGPIKYLPLVTAGRRLGGGSFSTLSWKSKLTKMLHTFFVLRSYLPDQASRAALDRRLNNIYRELICRSLARARFRDAWRFARERRERVAVPLGSLALTLGRMGIASLSYQLRLFRNRL